MAFSDKQRWVDLRARIAATRRMMASTAGLIGSDYTTKDQAWEMLEGLFHPLAHALTAMAIALIAGYNWYAYGSLASVPAAAIVIATFGLRLIFVRLYHRRAPDAQVSAWVRLFATSSVIAAFGWGSSLSILLYTTEGPTRFAVCVLICAPVQGASARAYAMPRVVILHIAIVLGIIAVTATVFGIMLAVPLALLYLWYQIGFVSELVTLRRRMLKADHDRRELLDQVTRYNSDLSAMNARLATFALTDGLTGVSNRRHFDQQLTLCLQDDSLRSGPLALLLIDVDHFKRFNDTYGHLAGDACLQLVAAAIQSAHRAGDFPARYGGEEFALILPAAGQTDALVVAERVRRAVESLDCSAAVPGGGKGLSVSIGVGIAARGAPIQPHELVQAADHALYTAKQSGRNCVRSSAAASMALQQPA